VEAQIQRKAEKQLGVRILCVAFGPVQGGRSRACNQSGKAGLGSITTDTGKHGWSDHGRDQSPHAPATGRCVPKRSSSPLPLGSCREGCSVWVDAQSWVSTGTRDKNRGKQICSPDAKRLSVSSPTLLFSSPKS